VLRADVGNIEVAVNLPQQKAQEVRTEKAFGGQPRAERNAGWE